MPSVVNSEVFEEYVSKLPSKTAVVEYKTAVVEHLKDTVRDLRAVPSPLYGPGKADHEPVDPDETIWPDFPSRSISTKSLRYVRAGPRKELYFRGEDVRAGIVVCGGLCPGINSVIRELVMCMWHVYGVRQIWGISYGLEGIYDKAPYMELNPDVVLAWHTFPGSMLGTSRGGFDLPKIMQGLEFHHLNQLFIIGGDGSHRAAHQISLEVTKRKLKLAVFGIPKTVDNDIPVIDKSFGFDTAVQAALAAIQAAHFEAGSTKHGVGLVKLMGRSSGFIAMQATLASRDVNICLVPEVPFDVQGDHGVLEYVLKRLRTQGHVVIVIAEGCGKYLLEEESKAPKDKSGNIIYPDAGLHLKKLIVEHCAKAGVSVNLKYLDPTYSIRSTAATASDQQYCGHLAQQAVHGAMAGHTACTVGRVGTRYVYLPFWSVAGTAQVDRQGRSWWRLVYTTGQPSFVKESGDQNEFGDTGKKVAKNVANGQKCNKKAGKKQKKAAAAKS